MKLKRVRNWKVVKEGLTFQEASTIFQEQKMDGIPYENISIRIGRRHFIKEEMYGVNGFANETFRPVEILSKDWEVLIPDTDEEVKCEKVRQMVKDSNCSGLTYDKIDNMTTEEIWKHLCGRMDKDQIYRMIKFYYSEKVYKEK